MITITQCSWCYEQNTTARVFCARCGHEAHVPRVHCQCKQCSRSDVQLQKCRHGQNILQCAQCAPVRF